MICTCRRCIASALTMTCRPLPIGAEVAAPFACLKRFKVNEHVAWFKVDHWLTSDSGQPVGNVLAHQKSRASSSTAGAPTTVTGRGVALTSNSLNVRSLLDLASAL